DERAARRRLSQDRIGGARTRGIVAMTSPAYSMTRTELWRWGLSFVAILALHCGIAAAIIIKPAEGDVLDNIEAIEVDFTTASFENAPPRDIAPGEEQIQTEQA